ncbi:glycerol-3-phosphate acyltransferase, partial [Vibrio parahaemolyticus]|nr:glycerol-3-phosphate acyltransferase [Vibrio parahaemolyticus]
CLIVFKHHQNIRRLLSGDEPKIGEKKLTQKNSA